MWFHPLSVNKNVHKYIWPTLCLTPEIKSKYFRNGECVGIGQTTVHFKRVCIDTKICRLRNNGMGEVIERYKKITCVKVYVKNLKLHTHDTKYDSGMVLPDQLHSC